MTQNRKRPPLSSLGDIKLNKNYHEKDSFEKNEEGWSDGNKGEMIH